MSEVKVKGNFDFLKKYKKQELMELIYQAEGFLKVDIVSAGAKLRGSVGNFISDVYKEKNIAKPRTLYKQIKDLRSKNILVDDEPDYWKLVKYTDANNESKSDCIHINSLYPYDIRIGYRKAENIDILKKERYIREDRIFAQCKNKNNEDIYYIKYAQEEEGEIVELGSLDCAREIGNFCIHIDEYADDEQALKVLADKVLTFEQLVKAFKIFKDVLCRYYGEDDSQYDENLIPIVDYRIIPRKGGFHPIDERITRCDGEYLGFSENANDNEKYAIIIQYAQNKKKKDSADTVRNSFIKRLFEATKKVSDSLVDALDIGETNIPHIEVEEIKASSINNKFISDFVLLAYKFAQKPIVLSSDTLSNINIENRIKMCLRITALFNFMHKLERPMYHRFLTYNNIVLIVSRSGEYIPRVIKFDFSQINEEDTGTIGENVVEAYGLAIKPDEYDKYFAPEWKAEDKSLLATDARWDKVDAFALGILCRDILYGKISKTVVDSAVLSEMKFNKDLIDALDGVYIDNPDKRWDVGFLYDALYQQYNLTKKGDNKAV